MISSPLQRAIARGLQPGGDLADELHQLDEYTVISREDGEAICQALGKLPLPATESDGAFSPLYELTRLFQEVEDRDAPAFSVLYEEGTPQLIRLFDALVAAADEQVANDLLFVLKILAMYGSREGAEKVVEAARRPFRPGDYLWQRIMSCFASQHPHREYVFEALSDPIPPDFMAVALLDSANSAAIGDDLQHHPFDGPSGWERLQYWLESRDPEHVSYAHSATASLPFIANPPRDQLLALAMDYSDVDVQLEAAWAAAKLGREAGLKILSRYCSDVRHSDAARDYLRELDREDLIPAEANEPDFRARADFARWLAHPHELGSPPDELEIVDHRTLRWPPDGEAKPLWLIRYRADEEMVGPEISTDCGLVGSTTWCFFTYKMHQRPPEDAYAIHCYWEMEFAELIDESGVDDAKEYAGLLGQWQGPPLEKPKIIRVAEISHTLKTPGRLVALASARLDGAKGWVVLDGPRSAWYPKSEQPADADERVVLMIHVGRQLLGFEDQPDRRKYLTPPEDRPSTPS